MGSKIKNLLGYVWAFPVTFFGLAYALLFTALGWYKWIGFKDVSWVWAVKETAPAWLKSMWEDWAGHAIGNVVVLKKESYVERTTLKHETEHVRQCMRLGIFQPIVYGICIVAMKLGCPGTDYYYFNPFEIDARRVAGQKIDKEEQ